MKLIKRKTARRRRKVRKYSYLGCPLTKNRSPWCFRICNPDSKGKGRCGRIAPHTLKGRIQLGVIEHEKKLRNLDDEKKSKNYKK